MMSHRISPIALVVPCLFAFLFTAAARAEEKTSADQAPSPEQNNVTAAYDHLVDEVEPAQAWNAKTPEEHAAWQKKLHATVTRLLGVMPKRVPLEVKWVEKEEFEKFTRHKIYVRTEEAYWAPVFYYVPHEVKDKKVPAIVCLHGHSGILPYTRQYTDEAMQKKGESHDLDYAPYLAENGYVTAAIVVRGWNETVGRQDYRITTVPRSCHEMTMNAFLMGMTPQGIRCWDAMRVVDFLQEQPEVDPNRIGVAGLSGGGTLTMYLPILDERIKAAMIGGAFSTYKDSIYSIHHCICNTLPGIMREADMADVVALYAPRGVLIINGTNDRIFPIDGAREQYAKLQQVYKLLDAEDHLDADFFEGDHAWNHDKTVPFLKTVFGE